MAAAQQLARAGHSVTLFEKTDRIGGLLRYGIPDFKMEKHLNRPPHAPDGAEGVVFRTNVKSASLFSMDMLLADYDAVVLSGGRKRRATCRWGANWTASISPWIFLVQQNKRVGGRSRKQGAPTGTLSAKGKHVVVIGGGDTGSDLCRHLQPPWCSLGDPVRNPAAAARKGKQAAGVAGLAHKLRNLVSHQEGCERDWSIQTRRPSAI